MNRNPIKIHINIRKTVVTDGSPVCEVMEPCATRLDLIRRR